MNRWARFVCALAAATLSATTSVWTLAESVADDCAKGTLVPYARVYINERSDEPATRIVVDRLPLDKQLTDDTIFVLQQYQVKFQQEHGILWIQCETWKDKEWMVNLSVKASDPEWLRKHREMLLRLQGQGK